MHIITCLSISVFRDKTDLPALFTSDGNMSYEDDADLMAGESLPCICKIYRVYFCLLEKLFWKLSVSICSVKIFNLLYL